MPTNSQAVDTPIAKKIGYLWTLVSSNCRSLFRNPEESNDEAERAIDELLARISLARDHCRSAGPRPLEELRILEIGTGQRCLAGLILRSFGVDYTGIDLD